MRLGRRLGIDVGDVRIGVASCDPSGLIATPVETVLAGPNALVRLKELVAEYEAIECIVGLPVGLSGKEGPASRKVREFTQQLAQEVSPISVRLIDERMSTITAQGQLHASGRSTKNSRSVIDQAAAVVILQTALDAEKLRGTAPGELVKVDVDGTQ